MKQEPLQLNETERHYINRMKWDIRLSKIQVIAIILFFIVFITTEFILLNLAGHNANYLKTLVCASDIHATDCPPPDAKSKSLTAQLKAAQDRRDATLAAKITVPLEKRIQELLDRPVQTRTVVVEGPTRTRTIVITRTRTVTVCRLPNGKSC